MAAPTQMSLSDSDVMRVAKAVADAVTPLKSKIESLEKLLTAQGGERLNDLLTIEQVAARLRVSKRTVLRYVQSGKLHAPTGTGQARRWRVRDLNNFGEAGQV